MKQFNIQQNIGKCKYLVNFHNGTKMHSDNSPFFDVKLFSSKKKMNSFIQSLKSEGYAQK